jgi:hypothetical protein
MRKKMTSLSAYNLEEKVLGKHEYFFKYLQISPSYWLAHKKLMLKENISNCELPDWAAPGSVDTDLSELRFLELYRTHIA